MTGELEEKRSVEVAQAQRVGKARNHGFGRIDRPGLLEARVPRDAHGRALRHLLAAETRSASATPRGQAELFRIQPGPPLSQESCQLTEPNLGFRGRTLRAIHSPTITAIWSDNQMPGRLNRTMATGHRQADTPVTLPTRADVVVVGSGITGAATAAAVAARGASVVVVDKEEGPAREASGRAQGALRLQGRHPSEFPLAQEALQLWREAASETSNADFELVNGGNLYFCTAESERPTLTSLIAEAATAGLAGVEFLDREQTREVIPAATGPYVGAMWSPDNAAVRAEYPRLRFRRPAAADG